MRFRPCIDIHNGSVKQIVGGSLRDEGSIATDNYVSDKGGEYYGELFKKYGLSGGHVIILNKHGSEHYLRDVKVAEQALKAFPGGLMAGGGITAQNAVGFLDMGASHVIVTSYVFRNGIIDMPRLLRMERTVGKEKLVLDVSCRYRDEDCEPGYYIVTDRWQNFTDMQVTKDNLHFLSDFADEFLIHAVDVEGKKSGVDERLLEILSECTEIPITYAGGIGSYDDIEKIRSYGKGKIDFTVGSALSIYGGELSFEKLAKAEGGN